ncbi:MAG: hypothetical protein WC677_07020 [Clostridia bacterium]
MMNGKNTCCKRSGISIFLFVTAIVVALAGIALLVNNILFYKDNVDYYVSQGQYALASKQLMMQLLFPGIFEPIGIIGIGCVLFGLSALTKKVSACFGMVVGEEMEEEDMTDEEMTDEEMTDEEMTNETTTDEMPVEEAPDKEAATEEKSEAEKE